MTSLISFVLFVLTIIATWKIFKKAGEDGWKSLIPIYNTYILFKIAKNEHFVKYLIGSIVLCITFMITAISMTFATDPAMTSSINNVFVTVFFLLFCVTTIWLLIIRFKMYKDLCEMFSLPTVFAWGLLLLNSVFVCILGFGEYEYNDTDYQKIVFTKPMETAEEVKDTEVITVEETETVETTETK